MTFNVLSTELDLNLLDADTLEKFDILTEKISKDIADKNRYEGLSKADGMRVQIKLIDEFLDNLFGEGTAEKVFEGNNSDLARRLDAFAAVMQASQNTAGTIQGITAKYGFNRIQNRATRRAKK